MQCLVLKPSYKFLWEAMTALAVTGWYRVKEAKEQTVDFI